MGIDRDSWIGREEDLERVVGLYEGGGRLVTIVGVGGIGKTRLARHLTSRWPEELHTTASFCDLTEARTALDVLSVITSASGLTPSAAEADPVAALGEALGRLGPTALVLDNAEHLADAVAALVSRLLDAASELRVLVTSRQPLGIGGEARYELEPLTEEEAVSLFIERARAAGDVGAGRIADLPSIRAIVQAVDRIPLAVELAAARASILTPAETLTRLTEKGGVLRGTAKDAATRHATMESVVSWSLGTLTPIERTTLAYCTIFRGGFTLPAAEALLAKVFEREESSVLSTLESLRHRSLVRAHRRESPRHELRFSLFTMVREGAARALDEEARRAAEQSHADYYLPIAERGAASFETRDLEGAGDRLSLELDNVIAIVDRFESRDPVRAARAALGAVAAYATRGPFAPMSPLIARAEAALAGRKEPALSAMLCARKAMALREGGGSNEEMRAALAEAYALADPKTHPALLARILWTDGHLHMTSGQIAEARKLFERAKPLAVAAGATRIEASCDLGLSTLAFFEGRANEAFDLLAETLQRSEKRLPFRFLAYAYSNLADAACGFGSNERVREAMRASVDYAELSGAPPAQASTATSAALYFMADGELEQARAQLDRGFTLAKQVGHLTLELAQRAVLGQLLLLEAHPVEAAVQLRVAIDGLGATHWQNMLPLCHAALAAAEAEVRELARAALYLDRARAPIDDSRAAVFLPAIEAYAGMVELERARQAKKAGDIALADHAIARARELSSFVPAGTPSGSTFLPEVRIARRLLERRLARLTDTGIPPARESRVLLEVARDGSWFRAGHGMVVRLEGRAALCRLLRALAELAVSDPHAALPPPALVARGWPGEKMRSDAGVNRLRVAIRTLRKLGLEAALHTRADGYCLEPSFEVRLID